MKRFAGLPVVATVDPQLREVDGKPALLDGVTIVETIKQLKTAGADVIGLNCGRGPETMLPILEDIVKECKVCTNHQNNHTANIGPIFQILSDPPSRFQDFFFELSSNPKCFCHQCRYAS